MKVYLAHAKANYASDIDGYARALRTVRFPLTLYSFQFLEGRQTMPIKDASISSRGRKPELAQQRMGPSARGR